MTTDPLIILAVSLSIVTAALLAATWRMYLLLDKVNELSRRLAMLEFVEETRARPKRFKAAE
jgi:hypothetical protein